MSAANSAIAACCQQLGLSIHSRSNDGRIRLQFEDPLASLKNYEREGIRISKIQLSAALQSDASPEALVALQAYQEETYLHQVKARTSDGGRVAWYDLPDALEELVQFPNVQEMRAHFHVPPFFLGDGPLQSTVGTLTQEFFQYIRGGICPHLEIETYTFDVLPEELRRGNVVAVFAYWSLPPAEKGVVPAPLDIEVETARGVVETSVNHVLKLTDAGWQVTTEIDVKPERAVLDRSGRAALENLKRGLQAVGATFADVVTADRFVTDLTDQDALNRAWGEYFRDAKPATTTVQVVRLATDPRCLVEINAIAVID